MQTALNQRALANLTPSGEVRGGLSQLAEQYASRYGGGAVGQLEAGYDKARRDISSGYSGAFRALDRVSGQQGADIRSSFGQQRANMIQGLARSGMAGTTVAPTMSMGIEREAQSSLNRLADLMAQQRVGLHERKGAALSGLERESAQGRAQYTQGAQENLQQIIAGVTSTYGPAGVEAFIDAIGKMGA